MQHAFEAKLLVQWQLQILSESKFHKNAIKSVCGVTKALTGIFTSLCLHFFVNTYFSQRNYSAQVKFSGNLNVLLG